MDNIEGADDAELATSENAHNVEDADGDESAMSARAEIEYTRKSYTSFRFADSYVTAQ